MLARGSHRGGAATFRSTRVGAKDFYHTRPGMQGVARQSFECASDVTGPFAYVDSVQADSTNTVWEIPIPIEPAGISMFFQVGVY